MERAQPQPSQFNRTGKNANMTRCFLTYSVPDSSGVRDSFQRSLTNVEQNLALPALGSRREDPLQRDTEIKRQIRLHIVVWLVAARWWQAPRAPLQPSWTPAAI